MTFTMWYIAASAASLVGVVFWFAWQSFGRAFAIKLILGPVLVIGACLLFATVASRVWP